ncbi:MAG: EF-P beta-lysylation protein EpmB [Pirellulales bacterium]|nr:EF-P beta-lysylation protein EpmB [Pirellulales bacterium]
MQRTLEKSLSTEWQSELARAVRDAAELCRLLDLPAELAEAAARAAGDFSLCVPRPYLRRIRPGDPRDPLLLQVFPQAVEMALVPGFEPDPLGESSSMPEKGLLWKYRGRILVVAAGCCAVHCRFCFRRHFPYSGGDCGDVSWESILQRVRNEPSVREVILSGGDPLTLPDEEIGSIMLRFEEIPHISRVRIHSRLPIMIPDRITDQLPAVLRASRLSAMMVVHANHPAEIDDAVAAALGRLVDAGIPVLSQGVLLRGVNDRVETLAALYERLADLRVMPYYLHQLDRVAGAAHFEVPIDEGIALVRRLRARLPGYAVPRYVRETQCGSSKETLA